MGHGRFNCRDVRVSRCASRCHGFDLELCAPSAVMPLMCSHCSALSVAFASSARVQFPYPVYYCPSRSWNVLGLFAPCEPPSQFDAFVYLLRVVPVALPDVSGLTAMSSAASAAVNKHLISLLFERFNILDHLRALKQFMLLGQVS